jgi:hypothetical protein
LIVTDKQVWGPLFAVSLDFQCELVLDTSLRFGTDKQVRILYMCIPYLALSRPSLTTPPHPKPTHSPSPTPAASRGAWPTS